jgi:hypothetical protein
VAHQTGEFKQIAPSLPGICGGGGNVRISPAVSGMIESAPLGRGVRVAEGARLEIV